MIAIKLLTSVKVSGKKHMSGEVLAIGEDIKAEDALYLIQNNAAEKTFNEEIKQDIVSQKDLKDLKVDELKKICKERGLKGFDNLKKQELIDLLENHVQDINLDDLDENALRELAKEEGIDIPGDADIEKIRDIISHELGA